MTAFQKTITILVLAVTAATWLLSFSTFGGPEGVEQAIVMAFFGLLVLAFTIAGTCTFIAAVAKKTLRLPSHLPLLLALLVAYASIASPFIIGSINSSRVHTVEFNNLTDKTYRDVEVEHPGFFFTFGICSPLAGKSYGMSTAPIPDHARLTAEIEGEGPVEIDINFTAAKAAWNKQGKIDTLHIVIARDGTGLGLIQAKSPSGDSFDGPLYPFESDPAFRRYRELVRAIRNRDQTRAGRLILGDAPLEWDDPVGLSPLEWACVEGLPDMVDLFLHNRLSELSAVRISHCYKLAAQNNSVPILSQLLAFFPPEKIAVDRYRTDALYQATNQGCEDSLRFLLTKAQLNPNMPFNDIGFSALHAAIQNDNPRAVEILLAHGADPHTSIGTETVIDRARQSGATQIVDLLESHATLNPEP